MDVAIEPQPGPEEREAILVALEELRDQLPPAYRSAWRAAALHAPAESDDDA